jgi:hypothetical protein
MDVVSAMRMGSNNPIFDKNSWKNMTTKNGTFHLSNSVCKQDRTERYRIEQGSLETTSSLLHFVEAMPGTAIALIEAAQNLAWDEGG